MTISEEQQKAIKSRSFKSANAKIPSPTKRAPAPHLIHYAVTQDLGTILAYTRHPTRDAQGFSGKAFAAIDKDEQLLDKLKITFLTHRRSEHDPVEYKEADSPQRTNVAVAQPLIAQPTTTPDKFPWYMMVRLVANPNDCTPENAKKWVTKRLVPYFNAKGTEYTFRPTFKVGSHLSQESFLSEVIVLSGTLEVMKAHYDELQISEILADDAKLSLYFRKAEEGRDVLNKYLGINNVCVFGDQEGDEDDF